MKKTAFGMGWTPDLPDFRDFTVDSPEIKSIFETASKSTTDADPLKFSRKPKSGSPVALPTVVDLRAWCSPIEDQGQIGSCTAQAGVGLLEYYERRFHGKFLNGSRLFLYKVTRNLLQWTGDTGAYLRTTMKAMAGFGVCPEQYLPYSDVKTGGNGVPTDPFEREPSSFCYSFAGNYKSIKYYRLDPAATPKATVLANIKNYVAAGFPCMFGFTVYGSIWQIGTTGKIPYPAANESVQGGHAVVIVGYDDNIEIVNPINNQKKKGAFLIRNSWGTGWGVGGYGYLPYAYVLDGLATDFWSLVKADFFDTTAF